MKETKLPRRRMLQIALGATAGVLTTGFLNGGAEPPATCNTTPEQDLGPFYPLVQGDDEDMDLTMIKGHTQQAAGEVILVRGRIMDDHCEPVKNALVEIWSANTHGRYHHERDTSPKELDPNFQGWGEVLTNDAGQYGFKTIKPGSYAVGNPDDPNEWRTPHLHFKVSRRGYHEIVTQSYFMGEKLNDTDFVLAEVAENERSQFILTSTKDASDIPLYTFDITMKKVRSREQKKADLAALAGTYEVQFQPDRVKTYAVRLDGEQLYLDLKDYTSLELKPLGKDEFLVQPIYCRLVFKRNAQGKVDGLLVYNTSKSGKKEEPSPGKKVT